MDAVEFLEAWRRMCLQVGTECEYCKTYGYCHSVSETDEPEKLVSVVEEWVKENSVNTRKSEFLKHYPNAEIHGGILSICPRQVDKSYPHCESYINCYACKEKYWLQEVE